MKSYEKAQKYFILFDLNGSLLYKANYHIKCPREPDLVLKKTMHFYIRPNISTLLIPLLNHPKIKIGVYSYIRRGTINILLVKLLEKIDAIGKKESILIYDHEYCAPDPMGKKHYDTLKNLTQVWNGNYSKKLNMSKYNTVFIESDLNRIGEYFGNILRIVPYKERNIMNPSTNELELMNYYKDYLLKLADSETENTIEYLAKNPLPTEILEYFDKPMEEFMKKREEIMNLPDEAKFIEFDDDESEWQKVESLKNRKETIKEMMDLINSVTIAIDNKNK